MAVTYNGSIGTLNINNGAKVDSFSSFKFYFISNGTSANNSLNHKITFPDDTPSEIILETGSIITILFSTGVYGISSIKNESPSVQINFFDGTTTTNVSSMNVINGLGITRRPNSYMRFVVISSDKLAAIETNYSYQPLNNIIFDSIRGGSEVTYSKVVVNETAAGSGTGNSISSKQHTSGDISPSFTTDSLTYSTSLAKTKGWFPVGISGWNCSSRFLLLDTCFLSRRSLVSSGSYTGWTAHLYWELYNPSSSSRAGICEIYIMWMR